ncbi:protein containing Phage P22, antirepressor protein [Candidatus Magnetobacterium bavaricum]|uniref:Protein containing Phage P22, antirepressor protein n=1 Tax=Candidatus Magnetobacterium bavaricum TaxID=29290 RepID=A0A0F3GTS3_9BACT|nr:protein containing Phage P22, antirepressor protein [Candidatus Magnetobacterium bavaricum]
MPIAFISGGAHMNASNNLPATTQIKFHEDTLTVVEQEGKVYVAMKPICQALGLSWDAQRIKIQEDIVLSTCTIQRIVQMPGGIPLPCHPLFI